MSRFRIPPFVAWAIRIAIVGGLIAWMASRINAAELARAFAAADPRLWLLAAAAIAGAHLSAAFRWHRLLSAAGGRWPWPRTLAVYAASIFLGMFIPTGVGGDVYRIARVGDSGAGFTRGTATILLERAVGLWALFLVGAGFVVASPAMRSFVPLMAVGVLGGAAGFAALWIPGGPDRVARLLAAVRLQGLGERLRHAFPAETMARVHGAMPGTVVLSIAIHVLLIVANVLLAKGFGVTAPVTQVASVVPLVLLAAQLPISPGGAGVREAAYVYFLGKIGVPEAQALAVGLAWFALLIGLALVAATGLLADRNSTAKTKTADGAEAPSADS